MAGEENNDKLFDDERFYAEDRLLLPVLLGKRIGEYFDVSRYIHLVVQPETRILMPVVDQKVFSSPDYAIGTQFEEDFRGWEVYRTTERNFSGYLVGFPRITDDEDKAEPYLHIWVNNASVDDASYAFPLRSLENLRVCSSFFTDMMVELDELAMGGAPKYQVPLLRDKNTSEIIYRDAAAEDIERAIDQRNDQTTLVIGRTVTDELVIFGTRESLRHLLDD